MRDLKIFSNVYKEEYGKDSDRMTEVYEEYRLSNKEEKRLYKEN